MTASVVVWSHCKDSSFKTGIFFLNLFFFLLLTVSPFFSSLPPCYSSPGHFYLSECTWCSHCGPLALRQARSRWQIRVSGPNSKDLKMLIPHSLLPRSVTLWKLQPKPWLHLPNKRWSSMLSCNPLPVPHAVLPYFIAKNTDAGHAQACTVSRDKVIKKKVLE